MVDPLDTGIFLAVQGDIQNNQQGMPKKKGFFFYSRISVKSAIFLNMKKLSKNSEFYWKNSVFVLITYPPGMLEQLQEISFCLDFKTASNCLSKGSLRIYDQI